MPTATPELRETGPANVRWGFRFGCDGLWTVNEAATHLRVCERTVWNLIVAGQLRKATVGCGRGRARVCIRSVKVYAESCET
jgi:hypothetical protein